MKRAIHLYRLSFFAVISFLFLAACGLDTYYTIDPPRIVHAAEYNSADYDNNYFEFVTASGSSTSDFVFLGTGVYYRIYADSSTMLSRQASISAVNNTSDYSAAAQRMIGYGYEELRRADGVYSPLVGSTSTDVEIRLTNYHETETDGDGNQSGYPSYINVGGTQVGVPRRVVTTSGVAQTFDFGRADDSKYAVDGVDSSKVNAAPASGDEDFESGSPTDKKYYVDMYAVSVGRDSTYTMYYSNVLHLGSVTIDANSADN